MKRKTWAGDSPYNMLDRNLKTMGLTMLIGAVLDVLLVGGAVGFSRQIAELGRLAQTSEMYYLALAHLIFPPFYFLAWMDTKRNVAIVSGAILARLIYALFVFALVFLQKASWIWSVAGGMSLLLAIAHYVFLRLSDFGFWEVFSRAGNPPAMRKPGSREENP